MFARMWFVMPFDILERSIGEIWSQPRDKHFFFCWTLFVNVSLYTFKKLLIVDNCWCHENRCFDIIYSIVSWCELSLENSSKLCYEALIKSRATEEYNLDVEYQQIIYLWRSDDSWLMSRFNLKRFFAGVVGERGGIALSQWWGPILMAAILAGCKKLRLVIPAWWQRWTL